MTEIDTTILSHAFEVALRAAGNTGWLCSELAATALSSEDVAEWIRLELLCCPFLTIQAAGEPVQWLTLTGGPGVKDLIQFEFPG